jgi:hypothetical protein
MQPRLHCMSFRPESTDPNVLEGALYSFVTSAGTDPEAFLILEARKPTPDREPIWHFAVASFTDLNFGCGTRARSSSPPPLSLMAWDGKSDFAIVLSGVANRKILPPAQNRIAGKGPRASTSVEMLTSRQRAASAARVASAWPANWTASLPSRRCAGRLSLVARRSTS